MSRIHYVLYEPPVAAWTACDRLVEPMPAEAVTTNEANVTCLRCRNYIDLTATIKTPRRLPPCDEVPF